MAKFIENVIFGIAIGMGFVIATNVITFVGQMLQSHGPLIGH